MEILASSSYLSVSPGVGLQALRVVTQVVSNSYKFLTTTPGWLQEEVTRLEVRGYPGLNIPPLVPPVPAQPHTHTGDSLEVSCIEPYL